MYTKLRYECTKEEILLIILILIDEVLIRYLVFYAHNFMNCMFNEFNNKLYRFNFIKFNFVSYMNIDGRFVRFDFNLSVKRLC